MRVGTRNYRTVWFDPAGPEAISIIDQRQLPFRFTEERLASVAETARAIRDMHVRGAGCIGAVAAWGLYLAAREAARETDFQSAWESRAALLLATRPTAVNLAWAVERQREALAQAAGPEEAIALARQTAADIADQDVDACGRIGAHGLLLLRDLAARTPPGHPLQILTHCNAGWLAFVDHGSATAPIYAAHDGGLPLHVWVDETRPRNQGARLTAWELAQHGVPHTVIADNTGGHLLQHRRVDVVLTGADRVSRNGDVANKIGTYLKALAAADNGVPFYVALPSSTLDWRCADGLRAIPIEERDPREVTHVQGWCEAENREREVRITPPESPALNCAFDVTPARLITGLITERGVCPASEPGLLQLFPERAETPTAPDPGPL